MTDALGARAEVLGAVAPAITGLSAPIETGL